MQETDFADREVEGLSRLMPNKLASTLWASFFTAPFIVFFTVRENIDWFLVSTASDFERLLFSALAAFSVMIFILLALTADYALVVYKKKHRRISHMTNAHPQMAFRWLYANATTKHWLALATVASAFFTAGFFVSSLS